MVGFFFGALNPVTLRRRFEPPSKIPWMTVLGSADTAMIRTAVASRSSVAARRAVAL
jgi:hypothetical protein